jgi:uncharacterized protein YdaT
VLISVRGGKTSADLGELEGFSDAYNNGKHYFLEQTDDGRYAVRAKGSKHASGVCDTQREAIDRANELNPEDHPDVERVRNTEVGGRDKWRRA